MLKVHTSALTLPAYVRSEVSNNTVVTIALTRTIPRKPKFNAIANMLRAHSTRKSAAGPTSAGNCAA